MNLVEEIRKKQDFKETVLPVVYSYMEKRERVFEKLDKEKLREKLRGIKENSISRMPELKKLAIANLTRNGIKVVEAKNAQEAKKAILDIIGTERLIVKSKSNVANEINLREMLKDKTVVETDVGDFIAEVCSEEDGHPVLPAMALTPERIADAINRKFKVSVKPVPEEIVRFVRNHLREKISSAKVGITGANAISADGSIMILENEGNISLVSRIAEKHIVISGFEKIVSSREEALHVAECAAVYGTGQEYPSYVNFISGPSKTADIQNKTVTGAQGAREVYLILVDNGRSELLGSPFKELLCCINCGACLNFCPIYHQITKSYGSKYAGARGVLFSAFSENTNQAYESGAYFCTMCRICRENCPAKIDLPDLMKSLREKLVKEGIEPKNVTEMIANVRRFGNPFGKIEEGKMPKGLYCC
jgi:L-lactate dehydrogenase complex protein LldF